MASGSGSRTMAGATGRRTPRSSLPGARNGRRSRSPVSTLPETRSITRPPWALSTEAFHENLVDDAPSDGLKRFLHGVDLVVESGALGVMLPVAFERVFDCVGDEASPWFLYSPASRCELDGAEQVVGRAWISHGKLLLPAGPLPQATGRAGAGGHASPLPRVRQAGRGHHARRLLSGRPDAGETRGRCREPTDRVVAGTLGLRGFRASVLSLKFA